MEHSLASAVWLYSACAGAMLAQPAAAPASFEVASIKPSDPSKCGTTAMLRNAHGRVEMRCITVKYLVQLAYDVRDSQISGGPGWAGSARYDILGTTANDDQPADDSDLTDAQRKTNLERLREILLPFLADRFQVKVHRETKMLPVYVLTVAKNGPKLKDTGAQTSGGLRAGRGVLAGSHEGIPFLAQVLSQIVGRTIVDQTGLKGKYDFELKWTPEQGSDNGPLGGALPRLPADSPAPDSDGPTIFTALQEQLGLKLESGRREVEVVVIDRAERPSEN